MADLMNLAARNWKAGDPYHDWKSLADMGGNKVAMIAGYAWNDQNWVMCIRFELPTPAKSINLTFTNDEGKTGTRKLRYKIVDKEDDSLINATSEVQGDGSFTVTGNTWAQNTVVIPQMLPAGIHYMYIWTDDSGSTNNVISVYWGGANKYRFSGTYEELDGLKWIKDGGEAKPYRAAIQTGEGVKIHAPYVFVQGEWKALN